MRKPHLKPGKMAKIHRGKPPKAKSPYTKGDKELIAAASKPPPKSQR